LNARIQTEPRDYGYAREVYSVDGICVTLDDRGWRCTCAAHVQGLRCTHVERATVFKQMRGVKREDDTIELELTASQLQALSATPAVPSSDDPAPIIVPSKPSPLRLSRWTAIATAVAVAAVSSGITYLAVARPQQQPVPVAEPQIAYALPAPPLAAVTDPPEQDPVRVVNPFDASEVFEFPAETSESDAQTAVAELLLKRAQDRLDAPAGQRRLDKTSTHKRPVHTTNLAQRS
jgi:hypothetical protein